MMRVGSIGELGPEVDNMTPSIQNAILAVLWGFVWVYSEIEQKERAHKPGGRGLDAGPRIAGDCHFPSMVIPDRN